MEHVLLGPSSCPPQVGIPWRTTALLKTSLRGISVFRQRGEKKSPYCSEAIRYQVLARVPGCPHSQEKQDALIQL
jgi:hypothetical protein